MVSSWPTVPTIGNDTESVRGLIDNFKEQYGHVFSHVMGLMFQANRVVIYDKRIACCENFIEQCAVDTSKPNWMEKHSPGTMIKLAWDMEYPLHPYTPSAFREMAHADVLKEFEAVLHQSYDRKLRRIVFESIRTFEYGEIGIFTFTPLDKKLFIEISHLWMPFLQHGDYVRFAEDYQPIIDRYLTVSAGYEAPIEIVWNLYDNLYVPGVKWRFQKHPTSFLFNSFHLALERSGNPELAEIRATMAMRRCFGGVNIYVDSQEKRDIILRNTSLWVPPMEWLVRAQIASVCGQAMYLKTSNAPPMPGLNSLANNSNESSTGVKAKPTPDHLNAQSAVPQ